MRRPPCPRLLNARALEALPAWLARARGNSEARALSGADWLLRRKRDGRFVATWQGTQVRALRRGALPPAFDADLAELRHNADRPAACRPLDDLHEHLATLGLDSGYGERSGLALVPEPSVLSLAGRDRYRRPLWLLAPAARAWQRMRQQALAEGIVLEAISGYRSHAYQLGIFQRKRARGLGVDAILAVNAAPGYSEHHGGCALDLGAPGEPPAEEGFEHTAAFAWLTRHAGAFGFRMSYPRDNPHGIVYEPWHWCWHPAER